MHNAIVILISNTIIRDMGQDLENQENLENLMWEKHEYVYVTCN